jgi:hypothetical protein
MNFSGLFQFTDTGLQLFQEVVLGRHEEEILDLGDDGLVARISGTRPFEPQDFGSARSMAAAILESTGSLTIPALLPNTGLWAWLTFVLRDSLFPKDSSGRRKYGEVHRWLPSDPNDWQKAQRHLVRMPVILLSTLGENADHLLCTKPAVLPEIREQLTSQQDMFHPGFQGAARALYFDEKSGRLKRGAGGKTGGSPRRLAKVRQQLDVTWDIFDLSTQRFLEILPREFSRFKEPNAA